GSGGAGSVSLAAACTQQLQPLFEQLFEFLARSALHQHVPVRTLVLFFLFELRPGGPASFVIKKPKLTAARVKPLRRGLSLSLKHHRKSIAVLGQIFHPAPRSELDSV